MKKFLQIKLNNNYSKRSICCPSFSSTAVRWVTTPFTAFSSIFCAMADTFWQTASFSVATDASWSRYTFDNKNPRSQKSKGVRSEDLGGHVRLKYRLIMRSSPIVERRGRCTGRAIWDGALSCIKVAVQCTCRACNSRTMLFSNSATYRWPVTETLLKPVFVTSSKKKMDQSWNQQ